MKRLLFVVCLLLTCLGCAATTPMYRVHRSDELPPSLIEYFRERDICQRANLISVDQLPAVFRDHRWAITIELTSGRECGRRMRVYSLDRPSAVVFPGSRAVVVYAERVWKDQGRYWGNILPIISTPERSEIIRLEYRPWSIYTLTPDEFFRLVGRRP